MQVKEAESKRRKARNQKRSWECSPARKSIKQANFSAFRPHPVRNFIPCEAPGNGQCLKILGMQRSDWQQSQVTRPHRRTVPVAPARGPPWPRPPQKEQEGTKITLNRKHPATAMPAQGQAVPGPLERQPPVKKRSHTQSMPKTKKSNADRFSLFYSGAWFPLPCWETIACLRLLLHDM